MSKHFSNPENFQSSEYNKRNIYFKVDGIEYMESYSNKLDNFMTPINIYGSGGELIEDADLIKTLQATDERNAALKVELDKIYNDEEGGEKALDDVDLLKFTTDAGNQNTNKITSKSTNNNDETVNNDKDETTNSFNPATIYESGPFKDDMMYPEDLLHFSGQDYMFFEQFQYEPPQPSLTTDIGTNFKTVLTQGLGRGNNISDPRGTCTLPIPNRLSVSDGVNWGEGRANALEASAFGAATSNIAKVLGGEKSIADIFKGATNQAAGAFATLNEQMKNQDGNANAATVLNAVLARGILSSIGINVDVDQFLVRQTGQAINPNLELLFGGPKLRSFSFEFNFAPNSASEAVIVRKIQRWFRQGMLAQKMSNAGTALFLGSPNIFRLSYRNSGKRIKGLNTFKICALTSAQINFTPDGVYQSYEDEEARSMPVRSTMGLTFSELNPIFANDYTFVDERDSNNNLNPNRTLDTSLLDVKPMISGENKFTKDDLGF